MFALNSQRLIELGIIYPEDRSFPLAKAGHITSGNFPGWDVLEEKLESNSPWEGELLLSSELLFLDLTEPDQRRKWSLVRDLAEKFRLSVLIFVRNPLDQQVSYWQQQVKRHGLTEPLDDWIRKQHLPPIETFLAYAKQHGARVIVQNYSRQRENLWLDVLSILGVPSPESIAWDKPPATKVNRALSEGELAFQMAANAIPGWKPKRVLADVFCNLAPEVKGAQTALTAEAFAEFVSNIGPEVQRVNKKLPRRQQIQIQPFKPEWQTAHQERVARGRDVVLSKESYEALIRNLENNRPASYFETLLPSKLGRERAATRSVIFSPEEVRLIIRAIKDFA